MAEKQRQRKFPVPCSTLIVEAVVSGLIAGAVYGSSLWTWEVVDGIVLYRTCPIIE